MYTFTKHDVKREFTTLLQDKSINVLEILGLTELDIDKIVDGIWDGDNNFKESLNREKINPALRVTNYMTWVESARKEVAFLLSLIVVIRLRNERKVRDLLNI